MVNSVINLISSVCVAVVFLFDTPSFLQGLETEFIVVCVLVIASSQWTYYTNYRNFYSRTNKFEDYYEMRRHFLENRKIFDNNDKCITDLKEMMVTVLREMDEIKRSIKNNEDPNRFYETVNKIHDRLDLMEKKGGTKC